MIYALETWAEYIGYNPDTGILYYKKSNHPKQKVGTQAGGKMSNGYLSCSLNGHKVLAHRLAWALHHGYWPIGVIDHINMNPKDNRITNLRDTSRRVNQENRKEAQINSSSGLLGAFKYSWGWRSQIKAKGKLYNLGVFKTAEEAHEAYITAKRKLHEGNTL